LVRIAGSAVQISSSPTASAVAADVHRLLDDAPRRATLGKRALERASCYSIDGLADRLLGVYRQSGLAA
jgi:hypothetical protein